MAVYNEVNWRGIKPTAAVAISPGRKVSIGAASSPILGANDDRTAFTLIVRGSKSVFLSLSGVATLNSVELEPGDVLSSDDYTGAVQGIEPGGAGMVHVFEV